MLKELDQDGNTKAALWKKDDVDLTTLKAASKKSAQRAGIGILATAFIKSLSKRKLFVRLLMPERLNLTASSLYLLKTVATFSKGLASCS